MRQDASRDPAFNLRARKFAPGWMAIFAGVITLVAFDWLSGLTPEWYSDIFGVYLFAGAFLAGLASTTLAVVPAGYADGIDGEVDRALDVSGRRQVEARPEEEEGVQREEGRDGSAGGKEGWRSPIGGAGARGASGKSTR